MHACNITGRSLPLEGGVYVTDDRHTNDLFFFLSIILRLHCTRLAAGKIAIRDEALEPCGETIHSLAV